MGNIVSVSFSGFLDCNGDRIHYGSKVAYCGTDDSHPLKSAGKFFVYNGELNDGTYGLAAFDEDDNFLHYVWEYDPSDNICHDIILVH